MQQTDKACGRTKKLAISPMVLRCLAASMLTTSLVGAATAQEALIRKNLPARLPGFPAIDHIAKTSIAGLYEVTAGSSVYYTDARGDHLIQGRILATKTQIDLTAQRIEKLSAVPFSSLPIADALVSVQGNGARKLAVFADPNCIHCKRLEQELEKLQDVTVYLFLYPILGQQSQQKASDVLCSANPLNAWREWMLKGAAPEAAAPTCDIALLQRNVAWGKTHRIEGTPAIFFENGKRVPGGMSLAQLQEQLDRSETDKLVLISKRAEGRKDPKKSESALPR
jgi:thiol:disulfide interchange protein DsbC